VCTETATMINAVLDVRGPALDWYGKSVKLEPVDQSSVQIVCDNTIDALLPDQGVARRMAGGGAADRSSTGAGSR
jgi:hypothetical protein